MATCMKECCMSQNVWDDVIPGTTACTLFSMGKSLREAEPSPTVTRAMTKVQRVLVDANGTEGAVSFCGSHYDMFF